MPAANAAVKHFCIRMILMMETLARRKRQKVLEMGRGSMSPSLLLDEFPLAFLNNAQDSARSGASEQSLHWSAQSILQGENPR